MSRARAVLLILLSTPLLAACSGDDTVNPTNPDASTAKATDAAKGVAHDGTSPTAGDALAEGSPDAPAD